jgi:plasmid stabilization system protein ParE
VKWRIVIRPRARDDINDARQWYDERQSGLGTRFLDEIEHALLSLLDGPDRRTLYFRDYRRVLTRKFPYKVFYLIEGEEIVVIRVLHAKQDHRRKLKL